MRKAPSEHAKEFILGERKIGNDSNVWEIVQTKKGVKRWKLLREQSKRHSTVRKGRRKTIKRKSRKRKRKRLSKRHQKLSEDPASSLNKNMELQKFWQKLASGKLIVLVLKNGTSQYKHMTKKTNKARWNEWRSVEEAATRNPNVVAILVSNSSWEAYDYLYARAKNKSVKNVVKNWKKYFRTSSGKLPSSSDKTLYPY
jgi:hypothetical protein